MLQISELHTSFSGARCFALRKDEAPAHMSSSVHAGPGVGLSYRPALRAGLLAHLEEVDCLEILADGFLRNPAAVQALASLRPCLPHSVGLSVGSSIDAPYLERLLAVVQACRPPWLGDHLAYTHAGGIRIGHLVPVPYTDESLKTVAANVRLAQEALGVPLALENITMPFYWPIDTMPETDFIGEVTRKTGCRLLLDLENLRINAQNHGFSPQGFLDEIPLERVVQIHLAGGTVVDGVAHDTHSSAVPEATWDLLRGVCERVTPPAIILEHDQEIPPIGVLLAQVQRARSIREGRHGA